MELLQEDAVLHAHGTQRSRSHGALCRSPVLRKQAVAVMASDCWRDFQEPRFEADSDNGSLGDYCVVPYVLSIHIYNTYLHTHAYVYVYMYTEICPHKLLHTCSCRVIFPHHFPFVCAFA